MVILWGWRIIPDTNQISSKQLCDYIAYIFGLFALTKYIPKWKLSLYEDLIHILITQASNLINRNSASPFKEGAYSLCEVFFFCIAKKEKAVAATKSPPQPASLA
jgi:hypothetical protein